MNIQYISRFNSQDLYKSDNYMKIYTLGHNISKFHISKVSTHHK